MHWNLFEIWEYWWFCVHIFCFSFSKKKYVKGQISSSKITSRLLAYTYICVLCAHMRIRICRDLVHLYSSGPPGAAISRFSCLLVQKISRSGPLKNMSVRAEESTQYQTILYLVSHPGASDLPHNIILYFCTGKTPRNQELEFALILSREWPRTHKCHSTGRYVSLIVRETWVLEPVNPKMHASPQTLWTIVTH